MYKYNIDMYIIYNIHTYIFISWIPFFFFLWKKKPTKAKVPTSHENQNRAMALMICSTW